MQVDRSLELDDGLRSPGDARRFVTSVLAQRVSRDDCESAALVVSELVTNAVLHAGSGCTVRLRLDGRSLRLEVRDTDPRPPVRRLAFSDELATGRGLRLLEVLATRWGVEQAPAGGPPGKVVWCDMAVRPLR